MPTVRRVAGAVVGVVAACVLGSGCSIDSWTAPTVAESGLESSLTDELEDKNLPVEDVDCPGDLRGREDETMSCTVSAAEGEYDVKLTVTEIDGSTVRYDVDADEAPRASGESGQPPAENRAHPPQAPRSVGPQESAPPEPGGPQTPAGPTIAASELQRSLESDIRNQLGGTVAVVCPDDVEARVGASTRCGVSDGTETLTLDVTVVRLDASGDFQVSYTPVGGRFPSEPAPSNPAPSDPAPSAPTPSEHGYGGPPSGPFETV